MGWSVIRKTCFRHVVLALVLLPPAASVAQTTVETIYIVPGSHLDIGFTDTRAGVRETRIDILDQAIDAAASDAGFYWFEEGAWAFDAWIERNRGDDRRVAQVRRLLQADRLGVGATWLSPLIAPIPEGLPYLTFQLDEMERDFGYRPTVAVVNDVPSFPETLVDELAARGIRYLLLGANMFISRPLPSHLTRTPFYWESSQGARVLTYIDPASYTAGIALGPTCAKLWAPDEYPADVDNIETMRRAIDEFAQDADPRFDALIVQQSFDNWDTECARYTATDVGRWNEAGRAPRVELVSPEQYFRHIEERYGDELPVYRAEWGGQWDAQNWAMRPVSFWRLRAALRSAPAQPSRETRAAVAEMLGHNLGACSSWGFDEAQVLESAHENRERLERAIRLAGGSEATAQLPAMLERPPDGPLPESWLGVLATDGAPARYRAGPNFVGPFLRFDNGVWEIPFEFGADDERLVIHTRIDRTDIPGSKERLTYVVIEIPLEANRRAIRLAPEGVPNALANDWLLGRPPSDFVIGPNGVRVIGLDRDITVRSPLVVSWSLHAPNPGAELTWLQGLIVAQSEHCELRGGEERVYPYEVLFEGEPALLEVDVQLEFR